MDELTAKLAAQIAVTVFSVAIDRWLEQDAEQPPYELVLDTLGPPVGDRGFRRETTRCVTRHPDQAPHFRSQIANGQMRSTSSLFLIMFNRTAQNGFR